MKIKTKPMKRSLTYSFMPVFAYTGINILVSVVYVFLIALPKLADSITQNAGVGMEEVNLMLNDILTSDSVLLMLLVNAAVLVYALRSFITCEGYAFDRRYENRINAKDILMMTVMALGLYFSVNIVLTVVVQVVKSLGVSMNELNQTVGTMIDTDIWLTIFVVGILAPVVEELLVRGLIFNRLRKIGSVAFAILTSSMIFSAMHLPMVVQSVYTFAVGALFAWAYYKYENILIPIILHILYNLSSFLFLIEPVNMFFSTLGGVVVFYFMGVGLTVMGIKYIKNRTRPEVREEFRELVRAEEIMEELEDEDDLTM